MSCLTYQLYQEHLHFSFILRTAFIFLAAWRQYFLYQSGCLQLRVHASSEELCIGEYIAYCGGTDAFSLVELPGSDTDEAGCDPVFIIWHPFPTMSSVHRCSLIAVSVPILSTCTRADTCACTVIHELLLLYEFSVLERLLRIDQSDCKFRAFKANLNPNSILIIRHPDVSVFVRCDVP